MKTKKDMHFLYMNSFIKTLKEYATDQEQNSKHLPKIIYLGVKSVLTYHKPKSKEDVQRYFDFISSIKGLMSLLTPKEFINIFPIIKNYDGQKYETKDYFYTRDYVRTLDSEKPIGEKITEFLWEYWNWDIHHFCVESIGCISDLRRYDGHLSVFEEFSASQGIETPNTFQNSKGQAFYTRQGKPIKIAMSNSRHLKVVN